MNLEIRTKHVSMLEWAIHNVSSILGLSKTLGRLGPATRAGARPATRAMVRAGY